MSDAAAPTLIAVDGGGTSCRFALLHAGARTDLQAGPANVSTDFDAAIATLRGGLDRLAGCVGLSAKEIRAASGHLGLAGVVDARLGQLVAQALGLRSAVVEDDRRSAVVGALGPGDGTVIGVGTGSFLARQVAGRVNLLGGWGFRLGDEASGADLGRGLLRCILHAADGLAPATKLTESILSELGGTPADVVAFAGRASPSDFAAFAPRIVAAAEAGDPAARALMEEGAAYLMRAAKTLGWSAGEPLCPIGGLAPRYAPFLPRAATESLVACKGTALDGALALASRQAGKGAE